METWKPIPGIEYYQASSLGRIRSLDRDILIKPWNRSSYTVRYYGQIITPVNRKQNNRPIVSIREGFLSQAEVGILVCKAFHGDRPPGMNALHKDDNPWNNHPDNLYWGTQRQNHADAKRNGKLVHVRGEKHGMAKLTAGQVEDIRARYASGEIGKLLAKEYGVSRAMVSLIINRKNWQ